MRCGAVIVTCWSFFHLTGCGAFPDDQQHLDAAMRNVRERAPFDFDCETPKLKRLGDVARLGQQMTRVNIGVICDGKKGSYVVTCVSNWGDISCTPELNSTGGKAKDDKDE